MKPEEFRRDSERASRSNKSFYRKLAERPPRDLDDIFQEAHEEVFLETDCLRCANCCKTTSPVFYDRDIDRAAKALRLRPGDFITRYLRIDEEQDYVLKSAPCPFLGQDNRCSIYSDRPAACREYPHTNRKRIAQILPLTYRNTMVCPAVLRITELVRARLEHKKG